jgi:hypothetical protein
MDHRPQRLAHLQPDVQPHCSSARVTATGFNVRERVNRRGADFESYFRCCGVQIVRGLGFERGFMKAPAESPRAMRAKGSLRGLC